jgi:hypothetical protein
MPALFWNQTRPFYGERSIFKVSRDEQYFSNQPRWREPYLGAANFLITQDCRQIGLELGGDDWEYPLWVAFEKDKNQRLRIEHIRVKNWSAELSNKQPFSAFSPCAIVSQSSKSSSEMEFQGRRYTRAWGLDPINIFLIEGSAT